MVCLGNTNNGSNLFISVLGKPLLVRRLRGNYYRALAGLRGHLGMETHTGELVRAHIMVHYIGARRVLSPNPIR